LFPSVNVLTNSQLPGLAYDSNGNPYLYVAAGYILAFAPTAQITTGTTITALVQGGNY
jgi:hypothetical protein